MKESRYNLEMTICIITTCLLMLWVSIPCQSQEVYMSQPFYEKYTGAVSCTVTFSRMGVTKVTTGSGITTYTLSLSNKVKYDQYATNLFGAPFSAVDIPYDERRQGAIVLFKDRTRLNLTVDFVENHFETKLSFAQFNTMASKQVIGVRLLKSKWDYDVCEADGVLVQGKLKLLSKPMNANEIREKQEAIEDASRKEKAMEERAKQKEDEELMREGYRLRAIELAEERKRERAKREVYMNEKRIDVQTICNNPDVHPEFPGGMSAVMAYIASNMEYPLVAKENGTQGRVIVQFVVNSDSSIVNVKLIKSVDEHLDQEALRLVGAMSGWEPGIKDGKAVPVMLTVPVMFRLQ